MPMSRLAAIRVNPASVASGGSFGSNVKGAAVTGGGDDAINFMGASASVSRAFGRSSKGRRELAASSRFVSDPIEGKISVNVFRMDV